MNSLPIKQYALRLTGRLHAAVQAHLFPSDGNEAAALALCGQHAGDERHALSIHELIPVPYDQCEVRTSTRITWSTALLAPLLETAACRGFSILKLHSHPTGYDRFSMVDDDADQALFASVYDWLDTPGPHASAIMLPSGRLFGRVVHPDGTFTPIDQISVIGDDLHFWHGDGAGQSMVVPEFARRHAQAFGARTTQLLSRLSIAVVGCSGTGSPTTEMLARLGVGELVLVDPDVVEEKNLNRILNTTMADARAQRLKVEVLARAIRAMGLGTRVVPIAKNLYDSGVARRVAACDVVFGCMDSVDGRHLLNHIAAFYVLPYIDVGVRIDAGQGGEIEQVCGAIHYLQPDGSSLLSRDVYTHEELRAAGMRRTDPKGYALQLREKYIQGVQEDRPAVISLNMQIASTAVNEFMARLHPYRLDDNSRFASTRLGLSQAEVYHEVDGEPCPLLAPKAGRGDMRPLLGLPELSERRPAA